MACQKWLFFPIFIFIFIAIAGNTYISDQIGCDGGNYTRNSTYRTNLDSLFPLISANIDINGFYNTSVGRNESKVYGSVFCRGDINLEVCLRCIKNGASAVLDTCSNRTKGVYYGEYCTLRYSDESMFGIMTTSPGFILINEQNSSNPARFNEDLSTLLTTLPGKAAGGGSLRKVAAANSSTADFQTIFSLLQCSPDLSANDCTNCLFGATQSIARPCMNKRGCRILRPICNLRYESYPFYNQARLQELEEKPTSPPPPPPPPPTGKKDDNSSTTIIIVVVVLIVGCIVLAFCVYIFCIRRRKQKQVEDLENTRKCLPLNWENRYKIKSGIAKGLLYLHEDSQFMIILGDLKPILVQTESL